MRSLALNENALKSNLSQEGSHRVRLGRVYSTLRTELVIYLEVKYYAFTSQRVSQANWEDKGINQLGRACSII